MPTPEYRSPEEDQTKHEQQDRIKAVLAQAVTDGTSLIAAMELGESPEVVEQWINKLWNGLRDNLSDDHPVREAGGYRTRDEDRLMAIVLLIQDRIQADAVQLVTGIRAAGGAE